MTPSGTLRLGAVGAALAFFLYVGAIGLDFGPQWDESYFFRGIDKSIQDLARRPGSYTYNGNYFNVGYVTLFRRAVPHLPIVWAEMKAAPVRPLDVSKYPALSAMQADLRAYIQTKVFKLKCRFRFLALSGLALVWVFLAARALELGGPRTGLWATMFLAGCWEYGYHARFIAVDAMMTQFAALGFACLFGFLAAQNARRAWALYLGAAAAFGLALSCKLTAVFLLLPMGLAPWLEGRGGFQLSKRDRIPLVTAGLGVFTLFLVICTPGLLDDPVRFILSILFEGTSYNQHGPAYAYVTNNMGHHLGLVFVYFTTAVGSHNAVLAILAFLLAGLGTWRIYRRRKSCALLFLSFAGPYLLFVGANSLMIVRNYLFFLPAFAVAFAVGVEDVRDQAQELKPSLRRLARGLGGFIAGTIVVYGAIWSWFAAESIRKTTDATVAEDAVQHILEEGPVLVSPSVQAFLNEARPGKLACSLPKDVEDDASVMLFFEDHQPTYLWLANRRFYYRKFISSWEINYEYGPTFPGKNAARRIHVLSLKKAWRMHIKTDGYQWCFRGEDNPSRQEHARVVHSPPQSPHQQ